MNRRFMLKTTAALAILPTMYASSAVAQDAPVAAEEKHREETKKVGSLSLATSRLAVDRASDEMVKAFAKWEVAEQETIADVLKSMESEAKAEGALKPPSEAEVERAVDDEGKAAVSKLKSLSGAEFDKAYVTSQLDGHRKLLAIQEDYLMIGQNREHLGVAKLARGQIKEHIERLETLLK
jgi:putative membrane protein